jgi:hypothetical protein
MISSLFSFRKGHLFTHIMKTLGLFFLLTGLLSFTGEKLVKVKVSDGISASIPQGFIPMEPEDIAQRLPSVRAPLGAYTSQDRVVDFTVSISATRWLAKDFALAQKFFKSGIYNLYDRIEMISEGTRVIRKKNYIFFEFESRMNGRRGQLGSEQAIVHYSYIQYLVEDGRTLVFAFNCPRDQRQQWQPVAHEVMMSLRVK